ncbi:DUF4123 domain-containing protein [Acinetobacter larvae]|uniref:DUF4123 domain-containing protein n=1 Tax=Acinetobacter larvae TaxID=1789224 RepID=UPI0026A7B922|nr:DUF4123 domain-containing protein [Acinetobacter larvae]
MGKIHPALRVLFKTYEHYPLEDLGLNIFALADAAQDATFLKAKALSKLPSQCLLLEAVGDKAREVSPHLLQLPVDFEKKEWQWVAKHVAGTSHMTLIVTSLSFKQLFNHLRQFLDVKLEGGLELFLAFWDPVVLASLLGHEEDHSLYVKGPIFSEQQKYDLLAPIQSWWYWNRIGEIQAIFGLDEKRELIEEVTQPLIFTVEQELNMVEATLPDHLIYYLKLNNAYLIDNLSDLQRYDLVVENIIEARQLGLNGT